MIDTGIQLVIESNYQRNEFELLIQKATADQAFCMALWDIAKQHKGQKIWRYLWMIDRATERNPQWIEPIVDDVYQLLLFTKNESVIRHTMKLVLRCPLNEEHITTLLDKSIAWMNNPAAKISSQVLGLEYFRRVCKLYPEMCPELLSLVEHILERGEISSGYKNRLRKVWAELSSN
jgi:hypothetical protein